MSATLTAETIGSTPVEPLLESLRARGIRIPRPDEVDDYLTHYPDVIELAEQVCDLTREEFDGSAELSLELYRDSEISSPAKTTRDRQDEQDFSGLPGEPVSKGLFVNPEQSCSSCLSLIYFADQLR